MDTYAREIGRILVIRTVVVGIPFGRASVPLFVDSNGGEYQLTCRAEAVPMRRAMPNEVMVVECILLMNDLV